jgi:hypothetical protein
MNMGIFGVKRGLPNSFCPLTVQVVNDHDPIAADQTLQPQLNSL